MSAYDVGDVTTLTIPQLLAKRAAQTPNAVALRHKKYGIWNETTYAGYLARAREVAAGLHALGVVRGEKVAVLADNIPAWVFMEVGSQALGAVSVGVYQSSVAEEVRYVLDYTDAVVVLAEDEEQVDKLLEHRVSLPNIRRVIYEDARGMSKHAGDDWFLSFEELLELGRPDAATVFDREATLGKPDDVCHFSLTSGTTGNPKAAMLSHRNLLYMGQALGEVDPLKPGDDYLSFLPMAWIGEQMMTVAVALANAVTVNFPESQETAMHDLVEIGPHFMFAPPRVWEGIQSTMFIRMQESYGPNRALYRKLLAWSTDAADASLSGQKASGAAAFKRWLAYWGLTRPLLDGLGFLRLKRAYTGGAALGPDVFRFYHGLGVNLKQIYGQTENIGIAYVHRDGDVRFDTVGKILPGGEVRITDEGEIISRSPAVVVGYYKRDDASAETIRDGWLHSGDAGRLTPDGHLQVIDRLSDVMKTANGETFSPQFIENRLKFSPYIKEAVAFGDGQHEVTAFLNVDPLTAGQWAEKRQIAYSTYMDLSSKPELAELILKEVQEANTRLEPHERVARFVLLYKLLDADDDELTRTGKVRRKLIREKYAPIVAALYDGSESVRVEATFKYQDGQTQRVETDVAVHRVPGMETRLPRAGVVAERVGA
ncbi:AMP-binding protein [Deinococcus radiopugnans]|uniref:Long-chain acyl-CoA synthetase n=1 Tax=Deinococcus radiopugnans ATCC 19172 TaxID=585398 RepID=A0A5C4Y6Y2_9DEIO|nr:AMP-binding protein [Deinococcus radiopugnans]MBB6016688.1 long-chain acyl-CoA synthetase [Deinococcus radiopugnans ATCC 19172]TNM70803.1 long-chain fatty acid--CoA ligase [Deinococcus radiopugnans ATCC 19172]